MLTTRGSLHHFPETVLFVPYSGGQRVLTVHADFDALGNRGGHPVGGDAQIGAHVQARDAGDLQRVALPLVHCEKDDVGQR